jgi:hypothetical protein
MKNTGRTHFKGKGLGTSDKQIPVSVKLPPEIDEIVKLLPNRSDYLRKAIVAQLERDGLLNLENQVKEQNA